MRNSDVLHKKRKLQKQLLKLRKHTHEARRSETKKIYGLGDNSLREVPQRESLEDQKIPRNV